ncbi:hypothetical protein GW17_00015471 [Ensete ventricosum]|nr:hypothetical protein GW17_00015471 [Ensete ventricosum]
MAISRVWIMAAFLALLVLSPSLPPSAAEGDDGGAKEPDADAEAVAEPSFVITLDASNFSETVSKHDFIVVEFYAPWFHQLPFFVVCLLSLMHSSADGVNICVTLQDFQADAIEKFIESESTPIVTTYDNDPINLPFVAKFFESPNAKVSNSL